MDIQTGILLSLLLIISLIISNINSFIRRKKLLKKHSQVCEDLHEVCMNIINEFCIHKEVSIYDKKLKLKLALKVVTPKKAYNGFFDYNHLKAIYFEEFHAVILAEVLEKSKISKEVEYVINNKKSIVEKATIKLTNDGKLDGVDILFVDFDIL